jgi:hypothetical protein
MQSFKSYIAEDLEVAELIRELTTPQLIAKVKAQTVHKKRYSYAKDLVQKIYDRKSKEGGSKGAKHGIGYYATQVAKQIPGVDARTLINMFEEHGAGDEGTDKLVNKYKKDTPMEGTGSSETWEAGYKRRVVKTTNPEHKEKGYNWRIKGKERDEISIKLYRSKPDFAEFKKQMKRVAGHEFGG